METNAASTSRLRSPSPPRASSSRINFSPPKRRAGVNGSSLKGKEKELDEGSGQAATYRHLLGNGNGGPASPLRCVSHIDIDAAYAAMEMARIGWDPAKPLAVQQWQGLIAINYAARAYGITRHESPADALKKCPHLKLVHCLTYRHGDTEPGDHQDAKPETHKISLDHYRRESLKIISIFREFCPVVQKASIDESFLDLTLPVRSELLARWPALAKVPDGCDLDSPLLPPKEFGVDLEWDKVGNLVPMKGQKKEAAPKAGDADGKAGATEEGSTDAEKADEKVKESGEPSEPTEREDSVEEEEPELTWSDVALYIGAEIVAKCRSQVHERLGYTCSAGIASNKMLAKLCSAWKKPNAQTILRLCAVNNFLRPMPFRKIRNLGGKLGQSVEDAFDANTVSDLQTISLREMQTKLGEDSGIWLWEIVRGLDYSEVETQTQVKSMLSSKNFRPTISKFSEICHWMTILATELHLRLTEARDSQPGLWPKTITFSHRSPTYVVRSHQVAFPFTSRLDIPYISRYADKLLRTAVGEKLHGIGPDTRIGPYSNIQLSFSGLEKLEEGQKGIERFFSAGPVKRAPEMTRDGSGSGDGLKRRKIDEEQKVDEETLTLSEDDDAPIKVDDGSADTTPDLPTFDCTRCKKTISIPSAAAAQLAPDYDDDKIQAALQREKDEHADYHFARDMLEKERSKGRKELGVGGKKGSAGTLSKSSGSSKPKAKGGGEGKKQKSGQQSLTSFFS